MLALAHRVGNPAEILKRVAQMCGLPVKLSADVVAVNERIARFEVAMHKNNRFGLRRVKAHPGEHVVELGMRFEPHPAVLCLPVREFDPRRRAGRHVEHRA